MTRQGIEPGPLDQKLTLKPLSHHIRNLFGHVFSQQVVDERVVSSTNHGQPGILPTSNAQGELIFHSHHKIKAAKCNPSSTRSSATRIAVKRFLLFSLLRKKLMKS